MSNDPLLADPNWRLQMRNTRLGTNRPTLATIAGLIMLFSMNAPGTAYEQQIKEQAQTLAEKLTESDRTTLAVVDFTDLQGNVTELGRFLAEELSIGLAGLGQGFEVVDRTHLKAILKENKLSATGLIDPSTAREVGRIAGVGALITGTVTPLGDSVRLAVKVLDTESARIITSSTANIPKTRAIEELLRREIVSGNAGQVEPAASGYAEPSNSQEASGFLFQLKQCILSGSNLICRLTITNKYADCTLLIRRGRVIDRRGEQYLDSRREFAGNWVSWGAVRETAVRGIATIASLTFEDVPSGTSTLALLEVAAGASSECETAGGSYSKFTVQFRDVPVDRE